MGGPPLAGGRSRCGDPLNGPLRYIARDWSKPRRAWHVADARRGDAAALGNAVRDAEYANEEMAQLGGKISGRVRIGLITSVAQSTLRRPLPRLPSNIRMTTVDLRRL